jgi:ribonuclease HII
MIGIDEVGRGAWAGPLLVCAVRLNAPIVGLRDSKKLTAKKREQLSTEIIHNADIGYGWITSSEIDAHGLSAALRAATAMALGELSPTQGEEIVIDGTINFAPQYSSVKNVIRADDLYPAVSAASIVAKVSRDAYMVNLATTIPGYAFEQHVGYGTALHAQSIKAHGLCSEHRKSFKLPI